MPPKPTAKKSALAVYRPTISDSSLVHVPEDAIEGYQERIESGIDWTLLELAARYHKEKCKNKEIPLHSFSEVLENKIKKSILNGFMGDQETGLTLDQQWELLLPITIWDNEMFANEEGKICFRNENCITDDLVKLIKKCVRLNDREILKQDLKLISTLRVNDSDMTNIDQGLSEFKRISVLNLCGNLISEVDTSLIPSGLRILELQANAITSLESFIGLPMDLQYLGVSRNLLTNEGLQDATRLPFSLTVLDLSDNDIYHLEPVIEALTALPNLSALSLAGNPCSVCAAYARVTVSRLTNLKWLDSREIMDIDRTVNEPFEPHPNDLRSTYFNFIVFRVISVPPPPKTDKGAITAFHIELELPLLDSTRRRFLMFRRYESLIEMLPPPEDDDLSEAIMPSVTVDSKTVVETSSLGSDIYNHLTAKNSREIRHFTTWESNKVQWNKIMNFTDPTVRIFCPDLTALRDTFRTVITVRLVYTMTVTAKTGKQDKKSAQSLKIPGEQRVTLATIKCALKKPDWSQPSQHFHWDESLGTEEAIHWGDGDLSILQYVQGPVKPVKGKPETDLTSSRQQPPEILTCHFGFGFDTIRN